MYIFNKKNCQLRKLLFWNWQILKISYRYRQDVSLCYDSLCSLPPALLQHLLHRISASCTSYHHSHLTVMPIQP